MQLGKLKDIYNSGVKALDDISVELDKNSRSTFANLNNEVCGHSSRLEEVHIYLLSKHVGLLLRCCSYPSLNVVQFFGIIASEAEKLLSDFHSCLLKQEDMLKAYARQQREVHTLSLLLCCSNSSCDIKSMVYQAHLRAVEATRSVSKITVNFFDTLDLHASKLSHIVEEAHTNNDQQLSELERKFEVSTSSHFSLMVAFTPIHLIVCFCASSISGVCCH